MSYLAEVHMPDREIVELDQRQGETGDVEVSELTDEYPAESTYGEEEEFSDDEGVRRNVSLYLPTRKKSQIKKGGYI